MMNSIKRWLAPPVFEGNDEKTRRAELLNATLLFTLFSIVLIILGNLLGKRTPTSTLVIVATIFAISILLRHYLFRGMVSIVGIGVIIFGILLITASMVSMGTIRTPTTATFLFMVIIGGILYGVKGALVTTLFSSLAVAAMILAENAGLLPKPNYTVTITQWFTYTFLFGLSGYLTYFSYQTTLAALRRTQKEINERKRTEEALRESEARWQFALEGSGDGLWDWNVPTNKVFFSARWKTMLGYDPEEIGDTLDEWDKRVHPADRERVYAEINKHFEEQTEIYVCEYRVFCKDGAYKWILDRGKVISRTADGKPLRVIGTHSDITERKCTEEALRESEVRYRSLFDQTNDAVFILDLAGQHLAVNQRAADMLGYQVDELVRFSVTDISAEFDKSQQVLIQLLNGESVPLIERLFRKKDGQVFPVEVNVQLVRDKTD